MLKEFKKFISRGNVVDLAVGVVIGGAFGDIVNSLVNNIIMPLVGMIIGGINFSKLSWTIGSAKVEYGLFIQNVVNFLIIAFCIFMAIRIFNKIIHKKEEEKPPVPPKKDEVILLEEIRDLLKSENKKATKTK